MSTNFFEFREQVTARKSSTPSPPTSAQQAMTVSQLTQQIERALRSGLPPVVWVKGEISNVNPHRVSGHLYFTLKDKDTCIDCVMFKSEAARLKFKPQDGHEMLVTGRVAVYGQKGRYQIYASQLQPLGQGALELAYQQMRAKLEREGLFAQERKKALPKYPRTIALITSRQTAALQDMLKVLRRYPWLRICIYHVSVQGDGSAEQIAAAMRCVNDRCNDIGGIDVILLARGGGSLEDLWEFNEEIVARAVAASRIPIITGIGHEVDTSIADLVADHHAHTPTEAAQVVVQAWRNAKELVDASRSRFRTLLRHVFESARHRLVAIARHEVFRRPTDRINSMRQLLDDRQRALSGAMDDFVGEYDSRLNRLAARLSERHPRHRAALLRQGLASSEGRLRAASKHRVEALSVRLQLLEGHLKALSVDQVLKRGYTITTRKKDGALVRSAKGLKSGERIVTRTGDGSVESVVEDGQQGRLFE
ncbi:MAG TPA: exodeoxyribonuclease VII large subunit [Tepidisphaeraceae bacterium]|jgi:exodeoxyribonuclease VII large subunit|nr:exodeoxyribonuclease VII large subunit [Tepidisphaeraceae bacterium]